MSIFGSKHRHQWKLTGAVYQPRPDGLTSVKTSTLEQFNEVMYGSSLLTQECTECGWVSVTRVAGKPDLRGSGIVWADSKAKVDS